MDNAIDNKKRDFCQRLRTTNRKGVEKIITFLEGSGFFTAPASTRFHLSYEGGLVEHSINVYDVAMDIRDAMVKKNANLEEQLPVDSVVIASLLHDTCKADIYRPVSRKWTKMANVFGYGGKIPPYYVDYGRHPFGHGEKSVILLLQNGLEMTEDEMLAIRWHMGAWNLPFQSSEMLGNINKAKSICPLVTLIYSADELASQIMEG